MINQNKMQNVQYSMINAQSSLTTKEYKQCQCKETTMRNERTENIIKFLKNNIEPIENNIYGLGYRASAYLTDGTFLPCVIFRNPDNYVNLALKRFKEEQKGKGKEEEKVKKQSLCVIIIPVGIS